MKLEKDFPKKITPQHQDKQPGVEGEMNPEPISEAKGYGMQKKLQGKVAIITGGDSGIGKATALAFVREGAKVAIMYLDEHEDAENTKKLIEEKGGECILISGDIKDEDFCIKSVEEVFKRFKRIDILINNAAEQHAKDSILNITKDQLERTFKTNFFGAFYMTKAVLKYMKEGSSIINTTSVTAYKGHDTLIDYSCTKGALTTFTRSMATSLAKNNIRVNAVAPGPIWTPLIPSSFDEKKVSEFGQNTALKRPGEPVEIAEAYVFLASKDASYITGETIHINGGEIINC